MEYNPFIWRRIFDVPCVWKWTQGNQPRHSKTKPVNGAHYKSRGNEQEEERVSSHEACCRVDLWLPVVATDWSNHRARRSPHSQGGIKFAPVCFYILEDSKILEYPSAPPDPME